MDMPYLSHSKINNIYFISYHIANEKNVFNCKMIGHVSYAHININYSDFDGYIEK